MAGKQEEPLKVYPVPPKVWMGEEGHVNTHLLYRGTAFGKVLNLGPSTVYKSATGEIKGAPYKYADVTNDQFFNMYLNIIPGMHPFHWNLTSAVVYGLAPVLGALDGIIDDSYINDMAQKKYIQSANEGALLAQIAQITGGGMPKPSSGGNSGAQPSKSPSSWFKREIDAKGKGYSIKADGKKLNYAEHLRESGDSQEYIREMFAKGVKSLTFEAEGDKGILDYSESYRSLA